ncbi:Long-chain-fatty-acid--CoA ligase [Alloactinosynnema sp. L-07]|uniref:AMP-binding protein n=1 Tax=Alloactinosynnema sp. L-07 TaxID=1653480 RepID=UPI00065F04E6|nr:AMP-binding protein [Alloactinosynnema sp. L-07]CRK55116.1 Long-chain-fatty-acid--CoA ligase [Alloactinosynnema sp. L-07]
MSIDSGLRADLEVHPDRRGFVPDPNAPVAKLSTAGTVAGTLIERARREPDAVAYYLPDEPESDQRITMADLHDRAHAAGSALAAAGLTRGGRVCLCLDTSADLLSGLFGAALLGAVPSVIEPPLTAGRKQLWLDRVRHLVAVAEPQVLVCAENLREDAAEALAGMKVTVISPPFGDGLVADPVLTADPEDPAFIQFTSGTTSAAKGIVLSHRAVFAAASAIGLAGPFCEGDLLASWLPLHHDMGMVGATMTPFLLSLPSVLVRPLAFGTRPDRWVRLIHQYRATISPAPNFAYRLVASLARKIDLAGLDLSCWRKAFNGAEVVDAVTLREFQETMGRFGFPVETMRPCYGMAELGLAATFSPVGSPPRVEVLSRTAMAETGRAEAPRSTEDAHPYVSSGIPVPGTKVRVSDTEDIDLPDGHVGRVRVASESMMTGYLNGPADPVLDLRDGWLDTGDLGFLRDGELFVTGRGKDLIILAGRNYQPQNFERAAETVDGVRAGAAAAVGVPDAASGTEKMVLVVESKYHRDPATALHTGKLIERAVAEHTGVRPARVIVVSPRTLPKTSSGKLQRSQVAAAVAAGVLGG